ncbi:class I SAM-dependent rRNA methyltransferase [Metabacillus indicus]|uniref:class I SAM-dependent rRNA methyltransferase n=1 Tax=Metabacillus indicus TaxID=246786 RepID=UPI002A031725|nr:class I SAM-dependent rRNA methyltransferase [Metabacillus indicus]MDX8289794.1 class I SAM-dependent rRNA methyltransferase [Metabacillus indicus]
MEKTILIKRKYANEMKSGSPLIPKDALVNPSALKEEGESIRLLDEQRQFIGLGYYGRQNKGAGWILTHKEGEPIDQAFFDEKLKTALSYRKQLFESTDTTAFRVFNGEGDGIGGLTIDVFNGYYLLTWYSKGIYQFRTAILDALKKYAEPAGIYQKKRFDTKGQVVDEDSYVEGEQPEFPLIVKENGVKFAVYLNDGAMVGVFLDQREVRKAIRDKYAQGRTMLNLFSYTGAFSVYAALGGAVKTTSVDLANRSMSKTIEQFSINGIDYEAQDIIVEDVFHYFKYAVKKKLKFDMVVLDPPSFARSKKVTFSAAKDYKDLLKDAIDLTSDKGVIVASTNCSTFSMKKFKGFIETAFKEIGETYRILEEHSLPDDFKTIKEYKEGNYLKVVFIEKR